MKKINFFRKFCTFPLFLLTFVTLCAQNYDEITDGNYHNHNHHAEHANVLQQNYLASPEQESMEIDITPNFAQANTYGQWKVSITPTTKAVPPNGTYKIRFIRGFRDLQFNRPNSRAYCSAYTNTIDNDAKIISSFRAMDQIHSCWDSDVHSWVVTVEVLYDTLRIGDTMTVVFGGDFNYNNIYAHERVFTEQLRVLVDFENDDTYIELVNTPIFENRHGEASDVRMVINSTASIGDSGILKLAVLDGKGNPVRNFEGSISLNIDGNKINVDNNILFTLADNGVKHVPVTFLEEGYYKISGILLNNSDGFVASSTTNYVKVAEDSLNIFWGELHNHSGISRDGVGDRTYYFAKFVTGLDFFTATEHSTKVEDIYGINPEEWTTLKQSVLDLHEPNVFIPFFGFETSYGKPSGHYNMIFSFNDSSIHQIPNMPRGIYPNIFSVWSAFDTMTTELDAITIPHHTGKRFKRFFPSNSVNTFGGDYANPKYKTSIEIYSTHGLSEYYSPSHNLSYTNNNSSAGLENGPHYAQNAWALGEKLGVLASSDNHIGLPATNNEGVTAVITEDLNRDAIFSAIKNRHTYATTGERMIIEFTINGHQMGDEIELDYRDAITANFSVKGTDNIDKVELLKWDFRSNSYSGVHPNFEVVKSIDMSSINSDFVEDNFVDSMITDSSLYYLRAMQQNKVNNQEVWAWTSPIWIKGIGVPTSLIQNINKNLTASLLPNILSFNQNPVLQLTLSDSDALILQVYDAAGKLIKNNEQNFSAGLNTLEVNLPNLSRGQYFITLQSKETSGLITLPFTVN